MVHNKKWIFYCNRILKYEILNEHTISDPLVFEGGGYPKFSKGKTNSKQA
jgi:hypothetical protein